MSDDAPRKNWFSERMKGQNAQGRLDHELLQFEAERLKWLLQRFGLKKRMHQVIRRYHADTGRSELRFEAFNEVFPTFPFLIGCTKLQGVPMPGRVSKSGQQKVTPVDYHIYLDPASTEPARFKNFTKVPFVGAYKDFYAASAGRANGRKVALIFPRKGFLHGMVMHNDSSEQFWTEGLSWVYKVPGTENRLYVQPLSALVEAIYEGGRGWRPPGE